MKNKSKRSHMSKPQKLIIYWKTYGTRSLIRKITCKLGLSVQEALTYHAWNRMHQPGREELRQQRQSTFERRPEIAVIIDGLEGTVEEIRRTRHSVQSQTYTKLRIFEIKKKTKAEALLEETKAELFLFVKAGIELRPQLLYRIAECWNKNDSIDGIYFDEDCKIQGKYENPYFKPDKDAELILNFQYLGLAFAVSRELLEQAPCIELWGNDWYDLALHVFEGAGEIIHIPEVLFAKTKDVSASGFYRNTLPALGSCIQASLRRRGVKAQVEEGCVPGFFHVQYCIREPQPLVSIIIPNKDHIEELTTCIEGLQHKNNYRKFEIIVAENNSVEEKTFRYYERIQKQYDNVQVVKWEGEFNYSAINNFAVKSAKGELLLFLNNDTEIQNKECLEELVQCCYRPGIAAAGAMLYYPDDTIQHGGVVIGIGGFAAHALWSLTDREERYYPYSVTMREFSACTGACLMVKHDIFRQVGGFEEKLAVALNDVDLCMKIREAGEKIIFNPYAKMYHYESKSRGYEDSKEKIDRFNREIAYFQERWKRQLEEGDPYYNKNQTLHKADYSVEWMI